MNDAFCLESLRLKAQRLVDRARRSSKASALAAAIVPLGALALANPAQAVDLTANSYYQDGFNNNSDTNGPTTTNNLSSATGGPFGYTGASLNASGNMWSRSAVEGFFTGGGSGEFSVTADAPTSPVTANSNMVWENTYTASASTDHRFAFRVQNLVTLLQIPDFGLSEAMAASVDLNIFYNNVSIYSVDMDLSWIGVGPVDADIAIHNPTGAAEPMVSYDQVLGIVTYSAPAYDAVLDLGFIAAGTSFDLRYEASTSVYYPTGGSGDEFAFARFGDPFGLNNTPGNPSLDNLDPGFRIQFDTPSNGAIPEPTTALLYTIGAAGLMLVSRRRH